MKACIAENSFPKDDQSSSHVSVAVFAQFTVFYTACRDSLQHGGESRAPELPHRL